MKREFASRVESIAASVPAGVVSAAFIGAWLVLTLLFTFVGVVLVGTVVTAVGQSLGLAAVLITVLGVFGVPAFSLVLAQVVVAEAVERIEPALDRSIDAGPSGWELDSREKVGRVYCCQPPCC